MAPKQPGVSPIYWAVQSGVAGAPAGGDLVAMPCAYVAWIRRAKHWRWWSTRLVGPVGYRVRVSGVCIHWVSRGPNQ